LPPSPRAACAWKHFMSNEPVRRPTGAAGLGQDPPLTDWLTALSHDSPFGGQPAHAAGDGTSPPLPAVSSLPSLLTDDSPDVRRRTVTALGDLAGEIRRVLPALRAALGQAALHDEDDRVRTEAVRALLRAGPQSASEVGAFLDALQSEIAVVRFQAAL